MIVDQIGGESTRSIRNGAGEVDLGGAWESDSRGMWEIASRGAGEVVAWGAREVSGEAREIDWGGMIEVYRWNAGEVYQRCEWGKYKFGLKKLCCMLLLLFVYLNFMYVLCCNCFYNATIEINSCTHPPNFR